MYINLVISLIISSILNIEIYWPTLSEMSSVVYMYIYERLYNYSGKKLQENTRYLGNLVPRISFCPYFLHVYES